MFRYQSPDLVAFPYTKEEVRARARELVLFELQHQPLLKARVFLCGFAVGIALVAGFLLGLFSPSLMTLLAVLV